MLPPPGKRKVRTRNAMPGKTMKNTPIGVSEGWRRLIVRKENTMTMLLMQESWRRGRKRNDQ